MLNFQTQASSENNSIASQSTKNKKSENSGGGDFLATLLKSIKSENQSSQNSVNNAQNSTQSAQNPQNAQSSQANISEQSQQANISEQNPSNMERLELDEAAIAKEEVVSSATSELGGSGEQVAIDENLSGESQESLLVADSEPALDDSSFTQILNILEAANKGEIGKFPGLSSSLEKLISIEANINELKNVKSLQDLIKIAEKLDLNLARLSITKDDMTELKAKFPKLSDLGFFKGIEGQLNKAVANAKVPEKTPVSLANLLKEPSLPAREVNTAIAAALAQPKEIKEPKQAQKPKDLKSILNDDVIKNQPKKEPAKTEAVSKTEPLKTEPKAEPKLAVTQPKTEPAKPEKTEPKLSLKPEPTKPEKAEKPEPKIATPLSKEALRDDPNKAFSIQNYLDSISKKAASAIEQSAPNEPSTSAEPQAPTNDHQSSENSIKDMINTIKIQDKIITKEVQVQSVRTFASEMVEKISEFKPPVTRINMQLHPAELGEVNVTMIARANNLHVNITSTNSTMALFLQNQAEFKANLVNMGFSGIEMSFSDHKEGGQNQGEQGRKKAAHAAYEDENIAINELENANGQTSLEIVLPRYI